MEYFRSEYISENIIRICDIVEVAMYLVIGKDRACLLDTGDGFGNLAEYVATLTDKPVFVVLTHGHLDHANGAALFEEVYMSELDLPVYQEHSALSFRQQFYASIPPLANLPVEAYNPVRTKAFLPLLDKQVFDLGGISIEAISVPGHTQGMMMILIPEERTMLFGDACGVSTMIYEDYSTTISEYRSSLLRVKNEYSQSYDRVIRNHGTFRSPCDLLDNVIECCDDIVSGSDDNVPTDVFGQQGFFLARKLDEKGQPCNGKSGNILYRVDKAK